MKLGLSALVLASASWWAQAGSPVAKVLSMLTDLQAKVVKEGEVAQAEFEEFSEWCEDAAKDLGFEIKTGSSESETLKATIAEETAKIGAFQAKIEQLGGRISTEEKELKAATEIRKQEREDFAAQEKELIETIDMLQRAMSILEREGKGGASLLQSSAGDLTQALAAMVQASFLSTRDVAKLTAFLQDSQKAKDAAEDAEPGAPAAAAYQSHSSSIIETLQGLQETAEAQLADARKKESSDSHNFEMTKQSLKDNLRFASQDLADGKRGVSASGERKSAAVGDLDVTSKELAADVKAKEELHRDCMEKATSFESETQSRGEELKALAEAKKVIQEATGGSFSQVSFVQVGRAQVAARADQTSLQVVHLIRDLARRHASTGLMQLSSQISAAMGSRDPFGKVRELITDMIETLEQDAEADATEKAYCDKELSETNEKKGKKETEIEKLSTKIDRMSGQSSNLKEEVAVLQNELAKLIKSKADMDILRRKENAVFKQSHAEIGKGLTGIKMAIRVLSKYYAGGDHAHAASDGAGHGIIELLEVCEADFSKELATIIADEELAVAEYDEFNKAYEIDRVAKQQDVKHKTKEIKHLDKFSGELTNDRTGVQAELDAVNEYLSKIEGRCSGRAESYAARKAKREDELEGLKKALEILEGETALIQQHTMRHALRGHSA